MFVRMDMVRPWCGVHSSCQLTEKEMLTDAAHSGLSHRLNIYFRTTNIGNRTLLQKLTELLTDATYTQTGHIVGTQILATEFSHLEADREPLTDYV